MIVHMALNMTGVIKVRFVDPVCGKIVYQR